MSSLGRSGKQRLAYPDRVTTARIEAEGHLAVLHQRHQEPISV